MTSPDQVDKFIAAVFRHCDPKGLIKHYVFEHGSKSNIPLRSEWSPLSDLSVARETIEWSRQRPRTVYCPPVVTFADPTASTRESNVAEAPALALELDDRPEEMRGIAEAILGPATLVVRSGGVTPEGEDKLHLYWRLTRPARTEAERQVLKAARGALGAICEADMTAVPLMHPMRWPGSWHTKGEPRLCEIIEQTENELDLDAAYAILNEVAPTPVRPARTAPRDGFKTTIALSGGEAARLLSKIPNAGLTWEQWNRLGMTVWDATHASDEGRQAWHEWSALDARYDAGETDARWDHYFNSPPVDLSAASLYHQAGEVVPRVADPAVAFDTPAVAPGVVVLAEPPLVTAARDTGYTPRDGGIMLPDQQLEHFKGCVYVINEDKVITPGARLLGQSRFDNVYGGHQFVITSDGQGPGSKSAWEAFLRNQRYAAPTVDTLCFRPELPSLEVVRDGSWDLVNCYVPIDTPKVPGDPSPFIDHLSKLFPVERDRRILTTYMASCIQNPGVKFQWWPVLAGAKGNGKTAILNIMEFCIGAQYTHLPNTDKMVRSGINFNGWMRNKLFLGLEEIYSGQRRDFLEAFKPYVTNRRLPIEGKGVEEYTGDNRANGIMMTNHLDGVPIDKDERRYAPFFTAQMSEEDCIRDGLTSEYFVRFWDWLRADGFAIVNHYLSNYPIEAEFDPAGMATRRPRTSVFDEAVRAGRGRAELEVLEAIEGGEPGFCGGWVSSVMLDRLLERKRIPVPLNKRRGMMQTLGYDYHPALHEGRVNNTVQPDGAKPRLYVRDGVGVGLVGAAEVAKAYTAAQVEGQLGP